MIRRILVVCLGNICRSPTAEAVLRRKAEAAGLDLEIDSAGTGDWHRGEPPHPPMVAAAGRAGYDLTGLRARQIGAADFGRFDLILAADEDNLADIERLRPDGDATPVRLFATHAGDGSRSIPDPYYTKDFAAALEQIERAADGLLAQLQ